MATLDVLKSIMFIIAKSLRLGVVPLLGEFTFFYDLKVDLN